MTLKISTNLYYSRLFRTLLWYNRINLRGTHLTHDMNIKFYIHAFSYKYNRNVARFLKQSLKTYKFSILYKKNIARIRNSRLLGLNIEGINWLWGRIVVAILSVLSHLQLRFRVIFVFDLNPLLYPITSTSASSVSTFFFSSRQC